MFISNECELLNFGLASLCSEKILNHGLELRAVVMWISQHVCCVMTWVTSRQERLVQKTDSACHWPQSPVIPPHPTPGVCHWPISCDTSSPHPRSIVDPISCDHLFTPIPGVHHWLHFLWSPPHPPPGSVVDPISCDHSSPPPPAQVSHQRLLRVEQDSRPLLSDPMKRQQAGRLTSLPTPLSSPGNSMCLDQWKI